MDEFLRYVVQQLVEHPDEVVISHREEEGKTTYLLSMRRSDIADLLGQAAFECAMNILVVLGGKEFSNSDFVN